MERPGGGVLSPAELAQARTQAEALRRQIDLMPAGIVKHAMTGTLRRLSADIKASEVAAAAAARSATSPAPSSSDWEVVPGVLDDTDVPLGDATLRGMLSDLRACPPVRGAADACMAVLHACTLRAGYICTGVDGNAMDLQGFAPPVRDLPPGQFLPKEVLTSAEPAKRLKYRHGKDRRDTLTTCFRPAPAPGDADAGLLVQFEAAHGGRRDGTSNFEVALGATLAREAAGGGTVQTFLSVDNVKALMDAFEEHFCSTGFLEAADLSGASSASTADRATLPMTSAGPPSASRARSAPAAPALRPVPQP
mmetsp:Transcript_25193/g.79048  ORF Transcript_25193/g.79048 Transcript_25193/m.79048 type:complete len:308 (-) Transcript_25193:99-1022(-)